MVNKKYDIKYLPTFSKDLNNILYYMIHELKNKIVAENFYSEVKTEIEKRSLNPEAFEVYKSTNNGKNKWYRIYLKNYIIFYVVNDEVMEVRRILCSKRNFKKLMKK